MSSRARGSVVWKGLFGLVAGAALVSTSVYSFFLAPPLLPDPEVVPGPSVFAPALTRISVAGPSSAHEQAILAATVARAEKLSDSVDVKSVGGPVAHDFDEALARAVSTQASPRAPESDRLSAIAALNEATGDLERALAKQAVLTEKVRNVAGKANVGVYSAMLYSGEQVVAVNADEPFTAASTYKLLTALDMLRSVEDEDASWSDRLLGSRDLTDCFLDMIIESDNACPSAWFRAKGLKGVETLIDELEMENTSFQPLNIRTTARDLGHLLENLAIGDVVEKENRTKLREAMEIQRFRDGIPAGIPDARVADKVGFLEGNLHDAALVRSPKGDFVLVILTTNGSWDTIADIASIIYDAI